jgi:flavin-dependent dehydrogenase
VTVVRVVIVGGGPVGLAAAIQAQEMDADVTLLEAEQMGYQPQPRPGPRPLA